jgi:hypothetical protein
MNHCLFYTVPEPITERKAYLLDGDFQIFTFSPDKSGHGEVTLSHPSGYCKQQSLFISAHIVQGVQPTP